MCLIDGSQSWTLPQFAWLMPTLFYYRFLGDKDRKLHADIANDVMERWKMSLGRMVQQRSIIAYQKFSSFTIEGKRQKSMTGWEVLQKIIPGSRQAYEAIFWPGMKGRSFNRSRVSAELTSTSALVAPHLGLLQAKNSCCFYGFLSLTQHHHTRFYSIASLLSNFFAFTELAPIYIYFLSSSFLGCNIQQIFFTGCGLTALSNGLTSKNNQCFLQNQHYPYSIVVKLWWELGLVALQILALENRVAEKRQTQWMTAHLVMYLFTLTFLWRGILVSVQIHWQRLQRNRNLWKMNGCLCRLYIHSTQKQMRSFMIKFH